MLFYVLVLASSGLAGVIGALVGDGAVTGHHVTIVSTAEDPPVVETPTDDPQPGLLLALPLVALYMGTLMALPALLVGLAFVELFGWVGVPAGVLRWVALAVAILLGATVLSNGDGAGYGLLAAAFVAYAALFRVPLSHSGRSPAPRSAR